MALNARSHCPQEGHGVNLSTRCCMAMRRMTVTIFNERSPHWMSILNFEIIYADFRFLSTFTHIYGELDESRLSLKI